MNKMKLAQPPVRPGKTLPVMGVAFALLAAFGLVLGAACGNPFVPGTTGSLRLAVRPDNQAAAVPALAGLSRTIMPTAMAAADLVYDYALTRAGYDSKTGTALPFADLTALTLEGLAVGDWNLTVSAFNNGHALYAKTDSVSIVAGANVISWELAPLQTGGATAGLTVDLSWPTAKADGVAVYLSTDVDNLPGTPVSGALGTITETAGDSTARVTMTDQTSGVAYLTLQFALGSATVATVQELVQFYDHRTSVASIVLEAAKFSTAPDAPSALTVTLDQATGNPRLSWADSSNTETGFRVYRDGAVLAIAELTTPGTTSYIDSSAGNTAHTYEVRSFNSFGESSAGTATASWAGAGSPSLTFTLSNPTWQTIQFSSPVLEVSVSDTSVHTVSCANALVVSSGTAWSWSCENGSIPAGLSTAFTFTPANFDVGEYLINVAVTYTGVRYSGSFKLRVNPVATTKYTVTYSSLGADSGTAPVDTGVYNTSLNGTDTATVLGNPGNLKRANCEFLGWTNSSTGYGVIVPPGTSLSVSNSSGNITLYPAWLVMRPVPAGTFQRDGTATNLSTVSAFLMGETEITGEQFRSVMGGTGLTYDFPAGGISWYQAIAFCNALSIKLGYDPVYTILGTTDPDLWDGTDDNTITIPTAQHDIWDNVIDDRNANGFRLPTEMEWMWAAMGADRASPGNINNTGYLKEFAGDSHPTTSGDPISSYAWFADISGGEPQGVKATAMGNELGLYDMSGNVYEWCQDWAEAYPAGTLVDYESHKYMSYSRIMRGGAAQYTAAECALAYRQGPLDDAANSRPYVAGAQYGLRVVRKATESRYIPRGKMVLELLLDTDTLNNTSGYSAVSVSSNTGTFVTTPTRTGSGYSLDVSAGKKVVFSGLFSTNTPFTISLWFYPQTGGTGIQYLTYGHGIAPLLNYGMIYGAGATNLGFQMSENGNGSTAANCNADFTLNQWNHAVMVYDPVAKTLTAYMNGVKTPSASTSALGTLDPATSSSFGSFSGYLDDMRIYNRSLSASEVQALYEE